MNIQSLKEKFFQDPEWKDLEALIVEHIAPLIDLRNMDWTLPPADFKAEAIGRKTSYESLDSFLQNSKIISKPIQQIKNPFK